MTLSPTIARVGDWFRKIVPRTPESLGLRELLPVELSGTIGITRVADDCIEASIAGRIQHCSPAAHGARQGAPRRPDLDSRSHPAGTPVEARRRSSTALANADPFVWLQLFDDRGLPLTHETFLGRGVGIVYKVRAQIEVATLVEPAAGMDSENSPRGPRRSRLATGLHARVVTRTYGNAASPGHHVEVLVLMLVAAGAVLPLRALPPGPALAIVPRPSRVSMGEAFQ